MDETQFEQRGKLTPVEVKWTEHPTTARFVLGLANRASPIPAWLPFNRRPAAFASGAET